MKPLLVREIKQCYEEGVAEVHYGADKGRTLEMANSALLLSCLSAHTEDETCLKGLEGREQGLVVGDVVFEIGILYEHEVAVRFGEPCSHGVSFASRSFFKDERDPGVMLITDSKLPGPVVGVAFDDNNLDLNARDCLREQCIHHFWKGLNFVVDGYDYREAQRS